MLGVGNYPKESVQLALKSDGKSLSIIPDLPEKLLKSQNKDTGEGIAAATAQAAMKCKTKNNDKIDGRQVEKGRTNSFVGVSMVEYILISDGSNENLETDTPISASMENASIVSAPSIDGKLNDPKPMQTLQRTNTPTDWPLNEIKELRKNDVIYGRTEVSIPDGGRGSRRGSRDGKKMIGFVDMSQCGLEDIDPPLDHIEERRKRLQKKYVKALVEVTCVSQNEACVALFHAKGNLTDAIEMVLAERSFYRIISD